MVWRFRQEHPWHLSGLRALLRAGGVGAYPAPKAPGTLVRGGAGSSGGSGRLVQRAILA